MKSTLWLLLPVLLCGALNSCSQKQESYSHIEYTNSIQGELDMQIKLARWAYASGRAQAIIEEENEKLIKFGGQPLPEQGTSLNQLESEVTERFWQMRTNSEKWPNILADRLNQQNAK